MLVSDASPHGIWYNCSMRSNRTDRDILSFTYQTRIRGNEESLSAHAGLYGALQRRLFADVSSGKPAASLKSEYLRQYGSLPDPK